MVSFEADETSFSSLLVESAESVCKSVVGFTSSELFKNDEI
ncbi:hypothetical protein [Campylobacter gracilis]|nr:hypothetical protein [Campylobacter gracilis]